MCAGRPFFITIGVAQASWAPAASEGGDRVGEHLAGDVVDVDLELHGRAARARASRSASARVPTRTCTTLGRPAGSAVPAP